MVGDDNRAGWQQEAALEELETTLRQAVSRLALLASESNPDLASVLDSLRELTRSGANSTEIKGCLEQLSKELKNSSHSDSEPASGNTAWLGNLLEQLNISEANREPLDRIQARARRELQTLEIQLLVDDLASLLNRELADTEQPDAEKSDLESLSGLITKLLTQLSLPPDQRQQADAIIEQLQDQADSDSIGRALNQIADIVASLRAELQRERRGNEQFLTLLTQNLQGLESTIGQLETGRMESLADSLKMDNNISSQMHDLESSMDQATELTGLKSTITERLEFIRSHMEEFRRNEVTRSSNLEQQVSALRNKLQDMEKESTDLKDRITKEHRMAMSDPLTGIPNRLAYDEYVRQEYARWKRYNKPLSLAVWDVDRFKTINDSFGHKAGDKVLIAIAQLMEKQTRETDFVARFGGEEFIMLLPQTSRSKALDVAEKLRLAVQNCGFHFRNQDVEITISCGITEFSGEDTATSAFERADNALYKAKSDGRNRCTVA